MCQRSCESCVKDRVCHVSKIVCVVSKIVCVVSKIVCVMCQRLCVSCVKDHVCPELYLPLVLYPVSCALSTPHVVVSRFYLPLLLLLVASIYPSCCCQSLREAHDQFKASLSAAEVDFNQLSQLDKQILSFNVGVNPYTWFTMQALEDTWKSLQKIIKVRHFS